MKSGSPASPKKRGAESIDPRYQDQARSPSPVTLGTNDIIYIDETFTDILLARKIHTQAGTICTPRRSRRD